MEMSNPGGEEGAFNYAWKYLERLDRVERVIDTAFFEANYEDQFKSLVVYWTELIEWMDLKDKKNEKKEQKEHEVWYQSCKAAIQEIRAARAQGKINIDSKVPETFLGWLIALRKFKHAKGLTMPKKDDPGSALK